MPRRWPHRPVMIGTSNDLAQDDARPHVKPRLRESIQTLAGIAVREKAELIGRRLLDLQQRLDDDQFHLAVVGQFKRGKTSVINALLRSEVLPTGALPSTSVLTFVKHADAYRAEAVLESGERRSIPLEELTDHATDAGNPQNARNLQRIEVFYPSELLRGGVVLINCPGFGSTSDSNTQTAYRFLPFIDAAIFVTSPDPPLTLAEIEFLKVLDAATNRVFVVMNKLDLLDVRQSAVFVEYADRSLSTVLGRDITVFPFSAFPALAPARAGNLSDDDLSGTHLEQALGQFLLEARHESFCQSILRGVLAAADDLKKHIESRLEVEASCSAALQRARARWESELAASLATQPQIETSFFAAINQLSLLSEVEIIRFAQASRSGLTAAVRRYIGQQDSISNQALAASFDGFLQFQIQHLFDRWLPNFEDSLMRACRDVSARFLGLANEALRTMRSSACEVFDIHLDDIKIRAEFPAVQNSGSPIVGIASRKHPGFFWPRMVFRWLLRKKALASMQLDMEFHGRAVAQSVDLGLRQSMHIFWEGVRSRFFDGVANIRSAVELACGAYQSSPLRESLCRVVQELCKLEEIAESLAFNYSRRPSMERETCATGEPERVG